MHKNAALPEVQAQASHNLIFEHDLTKAPTATVEALLRAKCGDVVRVTWDGTGSDLANITLHLPEGRGAIRIGDRLEPWELVEDGCFLGGLAKRVGRECEDDDDAWEYVCEAFSTQAGIAPEDLGDFLSALDCRIRSGHADANGSLALKGAAMH